jgi:hypothetical protein
MADVTIKVLTEATSFALMTLDEAKVLLGMSTADTSKDAQLEALIDQNSAVIAAMCNRVFAREKVRESWRCLGEPCGCNGAASCRIFLTHFPVIEGDIEKVEAPGGTIIDPSTYELDEGSGKLQLFGGWAEPLIVTYFGGYNLPDDSPDALKRAISLMVSGSITEAAQAAVTGVRMIAHKDSRVMYHNPAQAAKASGGSGSTSTQAVSSLLTRFTQYWI